jgi:hypothetical protein
MAEKLSLACRKEERATVELADATRVVEKSGGEQEVAPEPPVKLGRLAAESCDADGVLEEAPGVGMVTVRSRGECAKPRSEVSIAHELPYDFTETRVRDFLGQELEESVQLVEVAARVRNKRRRVGVFGALDRSHVELEPIPEAFNPAEHAYGVALVEASLEELDVAPHPSLDPPAPIDELERQIRAPASRSEALLARDREDALHDPILGQLGDWRRDAHSRTLDG